MQQVPKPGAIGLTSLVLSRLCTCAVFMTYPACLSALLVEWEMSAVEGGIVQGSFTVAFALSLLVSSALCDRVGARRVFLVSLAGSAMAALAFAFLARSFETGAVALALVGLSQGGCYTPAIMLVSANSDPARKSTAIGWSLAGMSAGYVVSIFLSASLLSLHGYEAAFLATALLTVAGWGFGAFAVRRARDTLGGPTAGAVRFTPDQRRRSRLLTLGYIGHCWELFGMWAWVPAFLAAAALAQGNLSGVELGLWTALALHLTGFFSSFISGYTADRLGVKTALVAFAVLGLVCSAIVGWLPGLPMPLLFAFVAVYGFATIGDSAVLSSAMTDAVPPQSLGKVLGLRSVLGIGAGALAPVAFGFALDLFPGALGWGLAFTSLAAGGLIATVCALALPSRRSAKRSN